MTCGSLSVPGQRSRREPQSRCNSTALALLRRVAAEPDFGWEPLVRTVHQQEGIPYWDTASDLALITGWGNPDPPRMQQLCDDLDVDEDRIAQRCFRLGLAQTRVEVVDRVGADENGHLHPIAQISRDKTSGAVWVLAITPTARSCTCPPIPPRARPPPATVSRIAASLRPRRTR